MKIIRIIILLFLGISQSGLGQWLVYNPLNTKGIPGTMVSSGLAAADDKLWFGTDQGVACFDAENALWTNYNTSNWLKSNFIYQVFEDNARNIWVATNGAGVSRYSNFAWTNYTINDGLSYNVVRAISQSPDGTVWFGTYGHGICSYRPESGFKKHSLEAIANCYVLSINALADDKILIGTLNEGLIVLENDTVSSLQNGDELSGKKVFSIFRDHNNKIWLGTDHGAQQYDPSTHTVLSCPDSLQGKPIYAVCENQDNELVFTSNNKIYTVSNGSWSSFVPGNLINPTAFYSAFYDKEGNGWFGSSNQGLFKKNGASWSNYYNSTGIDATYYLSDMCEDKNHNLYFCSNQNIYRFDGQNWNNITKNTELQNDYFGKIISDLNGNIWFTSNNKGLYKYDGNIFTVYSKDVYLNGGYVLSLALGADGSIWAGTSGNGLYRYDGTKWTGFSAADGMASDYIQAIAFYKDGKVAVISPYGQISRFDGKNWTSDNTLSSDYYVVDMAIDSDNTLWIATYNGIIRYKDAETEIYFNNDYEQNYMTFIEADNKGQIWAGRYNNGLQLYSGGSWSAFNTSDGLSSNYLKDILFDSRGRTWILADNGINMSANFTNINEPGLNSSDKILIYPNPVTEFFDLQYTSPTAGLADIHFFSAEGRLIKQYNQQKVDIGDNTFHFESENWPHGLLFCRILMPGFSENIKLLKVSTH
jgi:ligand-binding sensor domain-containing protein